MERNDHATVRRASGPARSNGREDRGNRGRADGGREHGRRSTKTARKYDGVRVPASRDGASPAWGRTDDNAREAVSWFTKAIEADPNYAAAYAWRVCSGSGLPEFDVRAGERDVRRALELDPCDPEANRIMAFFELLQGNFEQAAALNRRAVELNPSDAYVKARCANVSTYIGEALARLSYSTKPKDLIHFSPYGASRSGASHFTRSSATRRHSRRTASSCSKPTAHGSIGRLRSSRSVDGTRHKGW